MPISFKTSIRGAKATIKSAKGKGTGKGRGWWRDSANPHVSRSGKGKISTDSSANTIKPTKKLSKIDKLHSPEALKKRAVTNAAKAGAKEANKAIENQEKSIAKARATTVKRQANAAKARETLKGKRGVKSMVGEIAKGQFEKSKAQITKEKRQANVKKAQATHKAKAGVRKMVGEISESFKPMKTSKQGEHKKRMTAEERKAFGAKMAKRRSTKKKRKSNASVARSARARKQDWIQGRMTL